MQVTINEKGNSKVAIITETAGLFSDVPSALDFMMQLNYEYKCNKILLQKSAITPDFFILSNTLAGQILQKFINYHMKLAIVGDFENLSSKSLRDFIFESNNGNDIFFLPTTGIALEKLHNAKG